MRPERLAVYTTIHPGALRYLAPWYRSLAAQTDRRFDLWVALDGVTPETVARAAGAEVRATWVTLADGTPAALRDAALRAIVAEYHAVVLVDSDDVLAATRVAAARAALAHCDVSGCALDLVDARGRAIGRRLSAPAGRAAASLLPWCNVFGLSNTAYRSAVLRACLPIPRETLLVDWLLATRAWVHGARLRFDRVARMRYRRHGANAVPVEPPFDGPAVLAASALVLHHHALLLASLPPHARHRAQLAAAAARVRRFRAVMSTHADRLAHYTRALNSRATTRLSWWWAVAHPDLEALWT